ncbi:MAG: hypothetical protein GX237_07375 [Clostridiales bacterium]|nr:hypothetical protein [Clostridiales bacterium]
MANVFKKLIRRELGEVNYHRYSSFVRKNIENRRSDSQKIFDDMYDKLKYRDIQSIAKMHNRLNDTMLLAFRITKNFMFTILFYLMASIYLVMRPMVPELTVIALILINISFIYKVFEFVSNKFCYIDAQIILVYKAVLDRIILNERKSMQEK